MHLRIVQIQRKKIDTLDGLHKVLKLWAKEVGFDFPIFLDSGGKIILHFDQDDKLRKFETQKIELKS